MGYAFVQDVPATWDTYRKVAEALGATAPEGLVIHVAGPTDEGFRMIGIWESCEHWARFRDDRLHSTLETLAAGSRVQPTYRDLNIVHLLSGRLSPPNADTKEERCTYGSLVSKVATSPIPTRPSSASGT